MPEKQRRKGAAIRCPYRLRTAAAQTGLDYPDRVDHFKQRMRDGRWDFEGLGKSLVYWRDRKTVYVSDGHHRINAAFEIGQETGDWSYLEKLLQYGKLEPGLPPRSNRRRFPTRGWWSRFLERLGC
jgi:hypothetical protein